MTIPKDLNPEALKIIQEAGWIWDPGRWAFVETWQPGMETLAEFSQRRPGFIGFETLRDDMGLIGSAISQERVERLARLRAFISGKE
jgi:hypothetical protein